MLCRVVVGIVTGLVIASLAGAAVAADAPPAKTDIVADMEAGKYEDALRKIAAVLPLLAKKDGAYNAVEIQTLKAECYMAMRNAASATAGFTDVEKAATDAKDKPAAAKAAATRILIQRKDNSWRYTPKTGKDKDPIDILDKAKRAAAIVALSADEMADAKAKVKTLLAGRALPPIGAFAKTLPDLRKVEYAGTQSESQTSAMASELTSHCVSAMSKVVNDYESQVDAIGRSANETTDKVVEELDPKTKKVVKKHYQQKKGLTGRDQSVLSEAIGTAERLPALCRELQDALDCPANTFAGPLKDADAMKRKAGQILRTDYSKTTKN